MTENFYEMNEKEQINEFNKIYIRVSWELDALTAMATIMKKENAREWQDLCQKFKSLYVYKKNEKDLKEIKEKLFYIGHKKIEEKKTV